MINVGFQICVFSLKFCILKSTLILRSRAHYSKMDYSSRAQQANNKYSGVVVTNDIRANGRKKLLLIGKTGAGKSSVRFQLWVILYEVFHFHDLSFAMSSLAILLMPRSSLCLLLQSPAPSQLSLQRPSSMGIRKSPLGKLKPVIL